MHTTALIDDLQAALARQLEEVAVLRSFPLEVLTRAPAPNRWSVLEVIEHMNLSSGHYIRRLGKLYHDPSSKFIMSASFTPGRWGEQATQAMRPDAAGRISWRMKTLFFFEPRKAKVKGMAALDEFETMLLTTKDLLEMARERGLEGPKVTSTLGPILKFKPGDAFLFPIAHQERHMLQIRNAMQDLGLEASLPR